MNATVLQTDEQGIVLFGNGREHLITMPSYKVRDAQGKEVTPTGLVWVTVVPSPPDEYAMEDPKVFEAVTQLANSFLPPPPPRRMKISEDLVLGMMCCGWWALGIPMVIAARRRRTAGRSVLWWGFVIAAYGVVSVLMTLSLILGQKARGVDVDVNTYVGLNVLPTVSAGEYEIQPLKATGKEAPASLNRWLKDHDFAPMRGKHLEYYAERRWTFLIVKVNKPADSDTMAASGALRPLRIGFAAGHIYYPLKISANLGEFSVGLYVINEGKQPTIPPQFRFSKDVGGEFEVSRASFALAGLLEHAKEKNAFSSASRLRLTRFAAYAVNSESHRVNHWDEDFYATVEETKKVAS